MYAFFFAASPFLISRGLWFSSRFTHEMPPELLARLYSLYFVNVLYTWSLSTGAHIRVSVWEVACTLPQAFVKYV